MTLSDDFELIMRLNGVRTGSHCSEVFISGEVCSSHILTVKSASGSKPASMHSLYLGPAFKMFALHVTLFSHSFIQISGSPPQMLTPRLIFPLLLLLLSLLMSSHSTVSAKMRCAFNQPLCLIVLLVNTARICLVDWQWKKLVNHRLTSLIFSSLQWWRFGAVPNADTQKDIISLQEKKGRIH